MTCLFVFRRDLRNVDNTGLKYAHTHFNNIKHCFIYDKRQIGNGNSYRSDKSIEFMRGCVNDLKRSLSNFNVYTASKAESAIENIIKKNKQITAVCVNTDYTQFSIKRDKAIAAICNKHDVKFISCDDQLLIGNVKSILTGSGSPYKVFTPFYNAAKKHRPNNIDTKVFGKTMGNTSQRGIALKIAKTFKYGLYAKEHDFPGLDSTSHLSRYLKFGVISIREAYKYSKSSTFTRQLYWKDFWTYINYWFPDYKGTNSPKRWTSGNTKTNWLNAWKSGTTGFPIVDAGMRQLLKTGFMHNRVRMITASFLTKDLLIDWHEGEKWFSKQLIDIDMAVNKGNWMSIAGIGYSSLPYFRVFNPWTSTKKYDKDCIYIKTWIPELKNTPNNDILNWDITYSKYNTYFEPIINHEERRKIYLKTII